MWLHSPANHLARLAAGQNAAEHKPSVLRQHTTIKKLQLGIVTADAYHALGVVHSHGYAVSRLERQGRNEASSPSVVVSLEALELPGLLAIGPGYRPAGGVTGKTVEATVHDKRLQPIPRRQELKVKACVAYKFFGHRLVKPNGYLDGFAIGGNDNAAVEVIIIITQTNLNAALLAVNLAVSHLRHQVPLFRSVVQTDGTTLHGAYAMLDDFYARVLFIIETAVETVAENQHVDALTLKIAAVVKHKVLRL